MTQQPRHPRVPASYPAARRTLGFAPAAIPRRRLRARTHGRAPLRSSASGNARAGRGGEPVEREGRGGEKARRGGGRLRRRGTGWRNLRGLPARVRLRAGGKPLALLSRAGGQGPSGCLVHRFLSGARPGSLHGVKSPWLVLTTGQWVFLCACALKESESQPASLSSYMPLMKNVLSW